MIQGRSACHITDSMPIRRSVVYNCRNKLHACSSHFNVSKRSGLWWSRSICRIHGVSRQIERLIAPGRNCQRLRSHVDLPSVWTRLVARTRCRRGASVTDWIVIVSSSSSSSVVDHGEYVSYMSWRRIVPVPRCTLGYALDGDGRQYAANESGAGGGGDLSTMSEGRHVISAWVAVGIEYSDWWQQDRADRVATSSVHEWNGCWRSPTEHWNILSSSDVISVDAAYPDVASFERYFCRLHVKTVWFQFFFNFFKIKLLNWRWQWTFVIFI